MKNTKTKFTFSKMILTGLTCCLVMFNTNAQDYSELEKLQDENMSYLEQIYKIVKDYPAFAYQYHYKDGKLLKVTVKGVDNDLDRQRLQVAIFDLKTNRNKMKNKRNRIGVFYSPDKEAKPEGGYEDLKLSLQKYLEYPEMAKDWGAEGTVYVRFVVDEDGEIAFINATEDLETSQEYLIRDLKQEAIAAVKSTSGEWIPAKVDGVPVSSMEVIPINFDFKKNPVVPVLL